MTDDFIAEFEGLHAKIGIFDDFGVEGPASVPQEQLAAEYRLSGPELDRKRRALARHASQSDGLAAFVGEDIYRRWWSAEWFRTPTAEEQASCTIAERVVLVPQFELEAA